MGPVVIYCMVLYLLGAGESPFGTCQPPALILSSLSSQPLTG